jgi:hypothetical protein
MEEYIIETDTGRRKRPVLLTLLCIVTFICSGSIVLLSLMGIIFSGSLTDIIRESAPGLENMNAGFFIVGFLGILIMFGLSLWGAILMFYLKKGGFILYVIPNGLKLVFLIVGTLSAFNTFLLLLLIAGIALIVLYSAQIRHMKA